jgi:hypothetical protein
MMKNITSKTLLPIANAYIILYIAYYWLETPALLNPVAILLVIVFGLHFFVAKRIAKFIFPTIFIALNLFMYLALFSEFSEFINVNKDAMILLIVGGLYLGLNILSGVVIILGNLEQSKSIIEV